MKKVRVFLVFSLITSVKKFTIRRKKVSYTNEKKKHTIKNIRKQREKEESTPNNKKGRRRKEKKKKI